MGVFTFGEALALAGLGGRRSGRPVRRGSARKGTCERGFWRAFDPRQTGRLMRAAELYDRAGKRPGERNGALGHVALEVLRALLRRIDYRTGRLDPALTTLMADTARSKGAVVRALASLRDHGFLGWIRRFTDIAAEGAGPRVRQASNAYRLMLPDAALRLLGARAGPPPLPDDAAHARAQAAGAVAAMEARMSIAGMGARLVGGPLGEALDRLADSLLRRESTKRTESRRRVI
ncbi:MAG: replication protein A [Sphingomonas sp.]